MRFFFVLLLAFSFFFFFSGMRSCAQRLTTPPPAEKKWSKALQEVYRKISQRHPKNLVTAREALRLYRKNELVLIDVRSQKEQVVSSIPTAIKVQPGKIDVTLPPWNTLPNDKSILVFCTVGERSGQLKDQLKRKGWWAFNLAGGLAAWSWEEGPLVTPEGEKTRKIHVWSSDYKDCIAPDYEAVFD
jgi:rhodanese-related sulfurtransferase